MLKVILNACLNYIRTEGPQPCLCSCKYRPKKTDFYLPCGLGVESRDSGARATVGLLCQLSQDNPVWQMQVMCCE